LTQCSARIATSFKWISVSPGILESYTRAAILVGPAKPAELGSSDENEKESAEFYEEIDNPECFLKPKRGHQKEGHRI
jgi:hypothetical protein